MASYFSNSLRNLGVLRVSAVNVLYRNLSAETRSTQRPRREDLEFRIRPAIKRAWTFAA